MVFVYLGAPPRGFYVLLNIEQLLSTCLRFLVLNLELGQVLFKNAHEDSDC